MELVEASQTVGSVLNQSQKQGSASLMLAYSKDIREFTQQTALEDMVTNETLDGIMGVMKQLQKSVTSGFNSVTRAIRQSQKMMAANQTGGAALPVPYQNPNSIIDVTPNQVRDVTPRPKLIGASSNLPAVGNNDTDENDKKSSTAVIIRNIQDITDATQETAFHLRVINRDLGLMVSRQGDGGPAPQENKPKPKDDNKTNWSDGIFGWIMDALGISGEFAALKGIFGKVGKRLHGTFKNIGKLLDHAVGGVWKVFKGLGESAWGLTKKLGSGVNAMTGGAIGKVGEGIWKFVTEFGGKFLKPVSELGGKLLGPLEKVFGPLLGKMSGITFAKAIPVIGWVITAVMSIKDAADALSNSKEITGKAKEFQSLGDKINVGLSGIISGFTFGLVSTKTVYKWVNWAEDAIGGAVKSVFDMLPGPIKAGFNSVMDTLFDPDDGVFGFIGTMVEGLLDKLGNGQYMSAAMDVIMFIPTSIFQFFKRSFSKALEVAQGSDKAGLGDHIKDMLISVFTAVKDWIVNSVKEFVSHPVDSIMSAVNKVKNIGSNVYDRLNDTNYSKREARVYDVQKRTDSINDMLAHGDKKGAASAYKDLQSFAANNDLAGDAKFQQQTAGALQTAQIAMQTGKPQTSPVTAIASRVPDAGASMDASKVRLDAASLMPQINVNPVIQMPPAPSADSSPLARRTEGSMDQGLAFANYTGS